MSVRKRSWVTSKGERREAWIVDYVDQDGDRHIETFDRKKAADARHDQVKVSVREGVHIAPGKSVTIKEAAEAWIKAAESGGGGRDYALERATIKTYRQQLDLHILPIIGNVKLCDVGPKTVRYLEDRLREQSRSPSMIRRIRANLGAILADAQEQGLTSKNAVRDLRRTRRRKGAGGRHEGRLRVGQDIPEPSEIKAILHAATGRWRPLLITAVFTGLRASELRGLIWDNVDLEAGEVHVRQRADRFNEIGTPKSEAGHRTVPLPAFVVNTLREWKLQSPKGDLGLVFPTGKGTIENLQNIIHRGLWPAQIAAGVTVRVLDDKGKPRVDHQDKPVMMAKYTGMHALRHFYASWCINRRADGGLELPPKNVQERLGHSKIAMTLDIYGHLFPRGDDQEALDQGVAALLLVG